MRTVSCSIQSIFLTLLRGSLVCLAAFLVACATSPYEGNAKKNSDALLQLQVQEADALRTAKPEGRIIFAGFAMHSQSKAFRGDVVAAEKLMKQIDPNALVFKLNNPVQDQAADWPFATSENIEFVLKKITALARPEDKVVILVATHGNVDVLGIEYAGQHYPHINSRWLNQTMAGLRGKPTLLVLSACYSGSLLEPLAGASRIIMTAAAKDRNSFGCAFEDRNTFFIDALLNQTSALDQSLVQLMQNARADLSQREVQLKLLPSLPQISVGKAVRVWANQPLKTWLMPQHPSVEGTR
jgi:Peptidase C13 family